MTAVDPEAARVYAAEAASIEQWGRRFGRVDEVRAYLDRLVGSDWFAERWPDVHSLSVERAGHGARWSWAAVDVGCVRLADLGHATVLHELAHLCAGPGAGHGAVFREALGALVRRELGLPAYGELRAALEAEGLGCASET